VLSSSPGILFDGFAAGSLVPSGLVARNIQHLETSPAFLLQVRVPLVRHLLLYFESGIFPKGQCLKDLVSSVVLLGGVENFER
jgi:hypothetical protein